MNEENKEKFLMINNYRMHVFKLGVHLTYRLCRTFLLFQSNKRKNAIKFIYLWLYFPSCNLWVVAFSDL